METYTFTANDTSLKKILDYFTDYSTSNNPYIKYLFKNSDVTITVYTNNKVVIQGKRALSYYEMFNTENKQVYLPQAGSDEVGTGDFFGPICVCAAFLDQNSYSEIKQYHIDDSKKLTDEYIKEITPHIIKTIKYSVLILPNEKYNYLISKYNLNCLKAILHNQAYINLINKGVELPDLAVVDDFCGQDLYYRYLLSQKQVIKDLTFQTKAESQYPAVACASIISRYCFLQEMEAMSNKYKIELPKGAAPITEEIGKIFLQRYGINELNKVCKMNFKNYQRLFSK
ncbi:MAG: ribonuclease HIII [Erysipelotrichia bacterium]|nr:ribonuclease HIII [Erysipelotrichia bacterium]